MTSLAAVARAAVKGAELAAPPERPWHRMARPKQLPPDHPRHHLADKNGRACGCEGDPEWLRWIFMAGRGTGKTLAGANWLIEQALNNPASRWAALAPTFNDVRKTCFEGPTGILRQLQAGEMKQMKTRTGWKRNELVCELSNGSVIFGFSAEQPDRIRGENLWGAWVDELCAWKYPEAWHEGLVMATRQRESDARIMVTTTPRPTKLILELIRGGGAHVTRASMWENQENLAPAFLAEMRRKYGGTRLGRQELEGELLEDVPGALWRREDIDAARVRPEDVPQTRNQVVVAVDPAVTSGEDSDETGIIVAARCADHGYVLADLSFRGTPNQCMRRAVDAYRHYRADVIIFESNNGGDYLPSELDHIDPNVPRDIVHATRGKALRAGPASVVAEQGRLHHAGNFDALEDQLCLFVPGEGVASGHDDRMDALVYAVKALGLSEGSMYDAYGVKPCDGCGFAYPDAYARCPKCNPGEKRGPAPVRPENASGDGDGQGSGQWLNVYRVVRCPAGHRPYRDNGSGCPQCKPGNGGRPSRAPQGFPSLPFAGRMR